MLFGNKGRQKFGGSEGQIGLQLWVKAYWP